MNLITLLRYYLLILGAMIFLAAFARLSSSPQPPANDLLAKSRVALGHMGLIVITLVYVLTTFCKG